MQTSPLGARPAVSGPGGQDGHGVAAHGRRSSAASQWQATPTMLSNEVQHVTFESLKGGRRLMWADTMSLWANPEFALFYSDVLAATPFDDFFWECPPMTIARATELPFEHCAIKAKRFRAADASAFSEHLRAAGSTAGATSFANLGGDTQLVSPCERGPHSHYGHIAAFVRNAPDEQKAQLWACVSTSMQEVLGRKRSDIPLWVSTEGSGVPWVHVRLDGRPKYYHHAPFMDFVKQ